EAAVARQTREFEARGREQGLVELAPLEGEPEDALWLHVRNLPATLGAYGAVVELSVLPSQLDEAAQAVQAAAGEHDVPCALFSHAGQSLWAALRGEAAPVVEVVAQLREWVAARKGWLVVQHLPAPLKGRLDPWALPRTDREIMRLLKTQFDPQGILNPGVLVGGI
ncbi:MAG: hypothetical protein HYR71_12485, partial [Chloroflexi bacterium]|nr:hypothetical protein [Chloroflexota bacterium]